MSETGRGLNARSKGHMLSFPTPTKTHISGTHSDSYGHFSTATCGVSDSLKKCISKRVGAFGTLTGSEKITTFKLVIKLG
jgi:hypothetical protein